MAQPSGRTLLTHLAVSVALDALEDHSRAQIVNFYEKLLGWTEVEWLARPDRLTLLVDRETSQYLNIRARDVPMTTSEYEHLGVAYQTMEDFNAAATRATKLRGAWPDASISEPARGSGGEHYFRVRYRLPVTIEVQCLASTGSNSA